jgi:hypothetical protein
MGDKLILGLFILFCITIFLVAQFNAPEWVLWTVEGIGAVFAIIIFGVHSSSKRMTP